ncbi:endonuclease VIII Nei2 [Gordonia sinesedis]
MPEGDTVYQAAARLRRALAGHRLERTDFRIPSLATVDLTGAEVTAVRSRGKHLLIDVTRADSTSPPSSVSIHSHLMMDGIWAVHPVGTRWRLPGHRARIVLRANGYEAVGFDLGILELLTDPSAALAHLGPDLLGDDWDAQEAVARISAQPDTPVGMALLDQRLMAGVGNVYRSEACFLRGIRPDRPVGDVDVAGLVDLCRRMLWANRNRPARTTTGRTGPAARLWVYGRIGQLCRRCGTPIERSFLGSGRGDDRVVYTCPRCQT